MNTVKIKDTNKPVEALAGDTHYILEKGATISVDQIEGIDASGTASGRVIEIDGTIKAPNQPGGGVWLGDQLTGKGGGTIVIGDTGQILDEEGGIGVDGDHSKVINHGKIDGYQGIGVGADAVKILNTGDIIAKSMGIDIQGANTVLHNSGTLTSTSVAVDIPGYHAGDERIVNTGTMSGVQHSVNVDASVTGSVSVINRGTMSGDVQLGSGDDIFNGHKGTLTGTVFGGAGNDTYVIDNHKTLISEANGGGIDTVKSHATYTLGQDFENLVLTGKGNTGGVGNALANHLSGNSGNNTLLGDFGEDVLSGGTGTDLLVGGADADTFVFKTGFGTDTVSDFQASGPGHDKIDLSHVDGITNLNQLAALITTNGSDVVIDFGHGDSLRLIGVEPNDLQPSDFVF